ncbi:MAG TPA: 2OG-Fe(II) oxygenase [Herpetosiphonaceae bacterium]
MLLVRPAFIPSSSCTDLISAFQHIASTAPPDRNDVRTMQRRTEIDGYALRTLGLTEPDTVLVDIRQRALTAVLDYYNVADPGYVEFTLLTEMRRGDSHALHADSEKQDHDGNWIQNHTAWRSYTAMVYLNTSGVDYAGGVLQFPELGQDIVPQAGLLVGFPCGHLYQHAVTPIQAGTRYALSIWMTDDAAFAERWD